MTYPEFESKYPLILARIEQTVASRRSQAQVVANLGFKRLPQYFDPDTLGSANVVYVPEVPMPPLKEIGLEEFSDFEQADAAGVTYLDTFFSRESMRANEAHHFHELVHVVQWRLLGPKNFLWAYADGLMRFGYRKSPLEVMAYTLEERFTSELKPFAVEKVVAERIGAAAMGKVI